VGGRVSPETSMAQEPWRQAHDKESG